MNSTDQNNDVTVVIRTIGERTTGLCKNLVAGQVPEQNIVTISERPFHQAVVKTFEMGQQMNHRWTIALDADVLLYPVTISRMLSRMSRLPDSFFFYQGLVLDKLLCRYRPTGPHLYRTKHFAKAMQLTDGIAESQQPESFIRKNMVRNGYHFFQDDAIYALHDFEQFYSCIYRKCFVHAQKHARFIPALVASWSTLWNDELDYLVAFKGLSDGIVTADRAELTPDFYTTRFSKVATELGLSEKPPLGAQCCLDTVHGRNQLVQLCSADISRLRKLRTRTDGRRLSSWRDAPSTAWHRIRHCLPWFRHARIVKGVAHR